jgi:hypothetical protein
MEQIFNLLFKGIIILYPMVLAFGTFFCYKRKTPAMLRFYYRMTFYMSARKLYAIIFFSMLLAYNFCCYMTSENYLGVFLAALLTLPFLHSRLIDRTLQAMSDYADMQLTVLVCFMAIGMVSGQHVIVVTGLTYLVAALFYPSSNVEKKIKEENWFDSINDITPFICRHYYGASCLFLSSYLKDIAQNNGNKVVNNDKEK